MTIRVMELNVESDVYFSICGPESANDSGLPPGVHLVFNEAMPRDEIWVYVKSTGTTEKYVRKHD